MDVPVVEPLARDLMPLRRDGPDQLRHFLGDPAQDEERGLGVEFPEQLESPSRSRVDSRLEAVPFAALNQPVERANLEIVLHRHRENVSARLLEKRARVGR